MQVMITLPLDPKLHAHNKGHWRAKAAATKAARQLAAAEAALHEPLAGKVFVSYQFMVPDRRRRDVANMIQACKPYIDGVVDAGLVAGDHWEAMEIGGTSVVVGDKLSVTLIFSEA
jgi:hypothetical protein